MPEETMLDKVVRATEEMRECLTEGHQLLKDLKRERKEIERTLTEFSAIAEDATREIIAENVQKIADHEIENFMTQLGQFQRDVENRISNGLDSLVNIMLYGTAKKKPGQVSVLREATERGKAPFPFYEPSKVVGNTRDALDELAEVEENL
jgi:molecular chaperone DnaK (HSP70)